MFLAPFLPLDTMALPLIQPELSLKERLFAATGE
jgi:hypothetical protein